MVKSPQLANSTSVQSLGGENYEYYHCRSILGVGGQELIRRAEENWERKHQIGSESWKYHLAHPNESLTEENLVQDRHHRLFLEKLRIDFCICELVTIFCHNYSKSTSHVSPEVWLWKIIESARSVAQGEEEEMARPAADLEAQWVAMTVMEEPPKQG